MGRWQRPVQNGLHFTQEGDCSRHLAVLQFVLQPPEHRLIGIRLREQLFELAYAHLREWSYHD
jgi:hypothetical protein